jgi:VCBS repeat protein
MHRSLLAVILIVVTIAATRASAAPPPVSFGQRSSYHVDDPTGIAVGDFDGDGHPDIAAIGVDPSDGAPIVVLLFSQRNGAFRVQSPALKIQGQLIPFDAIAAGNLSRNDAFADLALLVADLTTFEDGLQVFTNLGVSAQQVTFQPPAASLPLGEGPIAITVVDINGDGLPDLVVPNADEASISVFNKAGNNFIAQAPIPTGRDVSATCVGGLCPDGTTTCILNSDCRSMLANPVAVTAGRLNADTLPDLAVALNDDEGVGVHINTQQVPLFPSFADPVVYDLNQITSQDIGPTGVVIVDVNHDGHPDIALSNENATVTIHLNKGDGTFQNAVAYSSGSVSADGLVAADLNGDGNPDIVTRNEDDTITVLLGNQDGTFTLDPNVASLPVGEGLADLAVADFNGDGKLDVAVAEEFGDMAGTVSVILGGGVNPPPTPTLPPTRTGTPTATPTITQTPASTASLTASPIASSTSTRTVTPTPTRTHTPRTAAAGDADCNTLVNDADVGALVARLFDSSVHSECNGADANGDNATTAADLPATVQARTP